MKSAPGGVTITVDRNFRAPIALDAAVTTDEDAALRDRASVADDPDGIIGKDFLGLDSLTYTITSFPERGGLTGGNSSWTYGPAPAFYGDDRFTFKVNDGREDSNEANREESRSKPLNDPPEVSIEPTSEG